MTNTVEQEFAEINPFQYAILGALNRLGKPMYQGTVSEAEKEKRRKAGRVAKATRERNRG